MDLFSFRCLKWNILVLRTVRKNCCGISTFLLSLFFFFYSFTIGKIFYYGLWIFGTAKIEASCKRKKEEQWEEGRALAGQSGVLICCTSVFTLIYCCTLPFAFTFLPFSSVSPPQKLITVSVHSFMLKMTLTHTIWFGQTTFISYYMFVFFF